MADQESKTGAVLTWIGGIAATVIASVLIVYFTRPAPAPPPPPVTQIGLNGFVEDSVSQKPVTNAIVTADLGSKLATQPTDSEGRYAFIMDSSTPPAQNINVDVLAGGYAHYNANVPITSGNNFAGIPLQPNAAPVPAPQPGHPPATAPSQPLAKAPVIFRMPRNYNRRNDVRKLELKR